MDKPLASALVWLRRDLRADDHAALHHALRAAQRVWCTFVFDTDILEPLPRADRRVEFIRDGVVALDADLRALAARHGVARGGLIVRHGRARDELPRLAAALHVQAVYANHDDEPAALERDAAVRGALADAGVVLHTSKDHLVWERGELLSAAGAPYAVFTPYRDAWLKRLDAAALAAHPVETHADALAPLPDGEPGGVPSLAALGFEPTNLHALKLPPGSAGADTLWHDFAARIDDYHRARDFPAVKGVSYLGPHLRFGTVSVRRLAREAWQRLQAGSRGAETWLSELAWRDFFAQVMHHHPHVVGHAYRPAYDRLRWEHGRQADARFDAWLHGRTGVPIVDAGMRQLVSTGYMHNRLRMVAASFLVKHLGIDWRRGEAAYAQWLNDYELASNNGNWQWVAGTGCDAAPWFRIFNPVTQGRRFDPDGRFVRRYVPELAALPAPAIHAPWTARPADLEAAGVRLGADYPLPVVDLAAARRRTLERYAAIRE